EITPNHLIRHRIVEQSFFDQRDEQGTRASAHLHTVVGCAQRLFVCAATNRRSGSNHADVLVGAWHAARAPGSITPITGTENLFANNGSATEETVLHATTSAFAFFDINISASSTA